MAATPVAPTLRVKVVFMGELKRWAGRGEIEVEVSSGSTIAELAGQLVSICGTTFAQRALTSAGGFQPHVAIFIDGIQIGRLEGTKTRLSERQVELMLLPMYEGG